MGSKLTNVVLTVAAAGAIGAGIYFTANQPSSGDLLNQWTNTFTNNTATNNTTPTSPSSNKTCSNSDYTTQSTSWSDPLVSIGMNDFVQLDSASYAKLARAFWWEHCNADIFLKDTSAIRYDLARNVLECTDDLEVQLWASMPPYSPGWSPYIPYVPVYGGLTIPGDYHASNYLALDSLQGLDCLNTLSMPSKCLIYGSNCEDKYPAVRLSVDLSPLTNLPNLRALDLSNYYIPDLDPLAVLTNLEVLSLYGVTTTTVTGSENSTRSAAERAKLQKLHIDAVAGLTQLKFLDISNTNTEDISPIEGLSQLQIFRANDTLIGEGLVQKISLGNLKELRELEVADTIISNISGLEALPELAKLNISGTQVHNLSPLLKMTKLRDLNLSNISELMSIIYWKANFAILSKLTNLAKLNIIGTDVPNGDACPDLRAALPNTEIIGC